LSRAKLSEAPPPFASSAASEAARIYIIGPFGKSFREIFERRGDWEEFLGAKRKDSRHPSRRGGQKIAGNTSPAAYSTPSKS